VPSLNRTSPLHAVCDKDDKSKVLGCLIRAKANVHARDPESRTPLHVACLLSTSSTNTVRDLLEAEASLECRDAEGLTPLMMACLSCNGNAVKTLLHAGASVNAQDTSRQRTPLHHLLRGLPYRLGKPCSELVELLLTTGAIVNCSDGSGITPLMFAYWKGDLKSTIALLKAGATWRAYSESEYLALLKTPMGRRQSICEQNRPQCLAVIKRVAIQIVLASGATVRRINATSHLRHLPIELIRNISECLFAD